MFHCDTMISSSLIIHQTIIQKLESSNAIILRSFKNYVFGEA